MDNVFMNLVRGNRVSALLGLRLDSGEAPKFAHDYSYIEVPVRDLWNPAEPEKGPTTRAVRNQHLRVSPACTIAVKGYNRVLVRTHPRLQEVASCPALFLIDIGEEEQAHFWATFRKDFDLSELPWCVRVYMLS